MEELKKIVGQLTVKELQKSLTREGVGLRGLYKEDKTYYVAKLIDVLRVRLSHFLFFFKQPFPLLTACSLQADVASQEGKSIKRKLPSQVSPAELEQVTALFNEKIYKKNRQKKGPRGRPSKKTLEKRAESVGQRVKTGDATEDVVNVVTSINEPRRRKSVVSKKTQPKRGKSIDSFSDTDSVVSVRTRSMVRAHQRTLQEASEKKGIFNLENDNQESSREEESPSRDEVVEVAAEDELSSSQSGISTPFKRAYRFMGRRPLRSSAPQNITTDQEESDVGVDTPAKSSVRRQKRQPQTEKRKRRERQNNAVRLIKKKPLTSILFLFLFTGLIFGGIVSLASHEMAVNSKDFGAVSPGHWNVETMKCDEGYERVGSQCITNEQFHNEERRFFEELNNLETYCRKQKIYSCQESPRVALSNSEVRSFFSTHKNEQVKKLKSLISTDSYMKQNYIINSDGDLEFTRELPGVWHAE